MAFLNERDAAHRYELLRGFREWRIHNAVFYDSGDSHYDLSYEALNWVQLVLDEFLDDDVRPTTTIADLPAASDEAAARRLFQLVSIYVNEQVPASSSRPTPSGSKRGCGSLGSTNAKARPHPATSPSTSTSTPGCP